MKMLVTILLAVLVATGCDDLLNPKDNHVDKQFRGTFDLASATDQVARGCEVYNLVNSEKTEIIISEKAYKKVRTRWVASTTCEGDDTVTHTETWDIEAEKNAKEQQILKIKSWNLEVKIGSSTVAALFISNSTCGSSIWLTTTYDKNDDKLKGCSSESGGNTGIFMEPLPKDSTMKSTLVRLKKEGNGISVSTKSEREDDAAFEGAKAFYAPR